MSSPVWREEVPLAPMTSWRIGGPARAFCEPRTPEELLAVRRKAERLRLPVFLLGGGTNLLIADHGYPGLVVRYADRSRDLQSHGESASVRVGARAPLAGLARSTARAGWRGLEWAEGIPGSVAGAVVGNAGAYGGTIAERIERVEIVQPDGTAETWEPERMRYAYRSSILKGRDPTGPAVVAAWFRLDADDPVRLEEEIGRIAAQRRAKTPVGASCGSVFRNPPGDAAGRLIEAAGCKEMREGGAVVSALHANYIVNEGEATARDVRRLIDRIRERVRSVHAIELDLEIQLVGFGPAGARPDAPSGSL
ncbi:MAG: UDP-N-acetylmuramate dehydrogenase [Candidatus Eisenbacteria bacterium]|nr:UDP-N-acetylmuramate dehydrogenase [Candidatus Latescibacterota bacterium]MBD3301991.1 UDP-N-acetylmuramate dehydrogenase [Candidatus Eisenbacteria bacterium]